MSEPTHHKCEWRLVLTVFKDERGGVEFKATCVPSYPFWCEGCDEVTWDTIPGACNRDAPPRYARMTQADDWAITAIADGEAARG